MQQHRRSTRLQNNTVSENGYVCSCHGNNHDIGMAVMCKLCGYFCCKDCIYKRFDISSERQYKNITQQNFHCSHCTHNPQQPRKKRRIEIEMSYDELSEMKILLYSMDKFEQIEQKYHHQIKERQTAISKIKPATPLTDNDKKPCSKKQKLWSHFMSTDILKIIFMLTSCETEKSVLSIIKVCKSWRDVIHNNQNHEQFHRWLWISCVSQFGGGKSPKPFEWKHLVLIPKQYLKIAMDVYGLQEMNIEEKKEYISLVSYRTRGAQSDEIVTNIPLLIQIILKCLNLRLVHFHGLLCRDIFYVIGKKCKKLQCLWFISCSGGKNEWLEYLTNNESMITNTLRGIIIYQSDWLSNDISCSHFGKFTKLTIFVSRIWYVSGFALSALFTQCVCLEDVDITRSAYYGEHLWIEAIKSLAKHKCIRKIWINAAVSFDDECLLYLMDPGKCPNLQELTLRYHSCSQQMIDEFKRKKTDIHLDEIRIPLHYSVGSWVEVLTGSFNV
eukprot:467646_1